MLFRSVSIAIAEPICSEFSALTPDSEIFPEFLKTLPLYLTMDSRSVKVAIKLDVDKTKLKTEFNIKKLIFEAYKDDGYIKQICKDGEVYIFSYENKNPSDKAEKPEVRIKVIDNETLLINDKNVLKIRNEADFKIFLAAKLDSRNAAKKFSTPKTSLNTAVVGGSK